VRALRCPVTACRSLPVAAPGGWALSDFDGSFSSAGGVVGGNSTNSSLLPRHLASPALRYTHLRLYVLVADWVPERLANAEAICSELAPRGLTCVLVPAPRGQDFTPANVSALEAEGVVSLRELPPVRRVPPLVPPLLHPLFSNGIPNQLNATHNHRWNKALGNTLGVVRALQAMARDASALDARARRAGEAAPSERTLFVFLEDDALIRDYSTFEARVLDVCQRLPSRWDLLLLTPPPGMCERAAWLPPPWHVSRGGIMTPRFAFSRSTGVVHSAQGVQTLLGNLPAFNIVDMWYRALMRAGKLDIRIHCGDVVTFGATAAKQARRLLVSVQTEKSDRTLRR